MGRGEDEVLRNDAVKNEPSTRLSIRAADLAIGLISVGFGAVVFLGSRGLAYSGPFGPGPGFLPTWIAVGLMACGVFLAASRIKRGATADLLDLPDGVGVLRVGSTAGMLLALALLMDVIGFLLSGAVLVLFAVWGLERRSLRSSLVLAIGVPIAFLVVFSFWLGVPLPRGRLAP